MKKIFSYITIAALFSGCASFSISKESFVSQLKEQQEVRRTHNVRSLGTGYDSNHLEKIKCIDKSGNEVWLFGGKDVNFKITAQSTGNSQTMYFDTVFFENDTIFGLKSRILGGKRAIPVNDIAKVTINAEQAITEKVK